MELTRELVNTLDNKERTLKRRIRIANVILGSGKIPIQHRETLILKWITRHLKHDCKLWYTLSKWLSYGQIKRVSRSEVSQEDIQFVIQKITRNLCVLENPDICNIVMYTILKLLENQVIHQYFKHNLNIYCQFISQILLKVNDEHLFLRFVQSEHLFPATFTAKNGFVKYFLDICVNTFTQISLKFDKPPVFEGIIRLMQKCLFYRKHADFEDYLKKIISGLPTTEKHILPKLITKKLTSFYKLDSELSRHAFKLLFQTYCNVYSNDSTKIHKFFIIILEILGFNVTENLKIRKVTGITEYSLHKSLIILNEIFYVLTMYESSLQYNRKEFQSTLQKAFETIINLAPKQDAEILKFINSFIMVDSLMVEPIIFDILMYAMAGDQSLVKDEYDLLMVSILKVYIQLYKTKDFVSKILSSLKLSLNRSFKSDVTGSTFCGTDLIGTHPVCARHILSEPILNCLSEAISSLASWQIMDSFQLLMKHLNDAVRIGNKDIEDVQYIDAISILICCLLSSVRMAEHTVNVKTVRDFVIKLEDLKHVLGILGKKLLQREHNHVLMKAFLDMCYSWSEIYIVLIYYSNDDGIRFEKLIDNDCSAYVTYLHNYLTKEQWSMISQRVTNFGENRCQQVMQNLEIQKVKVTMLLEKSCDEDIFGNIVRQISGNISHSWLELLKDPFVVNSMIVKMDRNSIKFLAGNLLKRAMVNSQSGFLKIMPKFECQILIHAVLFKTIYKINKLLKQNVKDENCSSRSHLLSYSLYNNIDEDMFFCTTENENVLKTLRLIIIENKQTKFDCGFEINEKALEKNLLILKELPVTSSHPHIQLIFALYLLALLVDLSNADKCLFVRSSCELLLRGVLQVHCDTLCKFLSPSIFVAVIIDHFLAYEETVRNIIESCFKSEENIRNFSPTINLLMTRLDHKKYSKCRVIFLNVTSKFKKANLPSETKLLIAAYRKQIFDGVLEFIIKDSKYEFTQEYILLLRNSIANNADKELQKLLPLLAGYIDHAFTSDVDSSSLLLFTTILNHKSQLQLDEKDLKKIWDKCKLIHTSENQISQEYLQVAVLIFTHVSNEKFFNIVQELSILTVNELKLNNCIKVSNYLKIWNSVLSCSFNVEKMKIWYNVLQLLLDKILAVIASNGLEEFIYEHVINFETIIISNTQFHLTPTIMDMLLCTVSALLRRKLHKFTATYEQCLNFLRSLLKFRTELILERLPSFLQQYRMLFKKLCVESNANKNLTPSEIHDISNCSHELEKLTKLFVTYNRHMGRISMYIIADILHQFELIVLYPTVKIHLNNCIYSLISLCDQHAVTFLLRALSPASAELFKTMHEYYKKYYMFTGKV